MAQAKATPLVPSRSRLSVGLRRRIGHDTVTAYVFLAVPLLIFVLIKFYPLIYNVVLSFTDYDLVNPLVYVGLRNYEYVVTNPTIANAIRNTLLFTLAAVPAGTLLSLAVAGLLNQPIKGRITFRALYYLPVVTSTIVAATVWGFIYINRGGLLNHYLEMVGIPGQDWLNDPQWALLSLAVVIVWGALGANMVVFLAGLQDIPDSLYEAAKVDGATGPQTFRMVTIPLLRPVILFVVVTFSVGVFRSFGIIYVLTQGGPGQSTNTLVWEAYLNAFAYLRLGRASAIAVVLVVIILAITAVYFRLLRED